MEGANDTSVMKNIKFVVLSLQEDDLHLVEEAKAQESKWKLGANAGDSTNGGNGESIRHFPLCKHLSLVQGNSRKTKDNDGDHDNHGMPGRRDDSKDRGNKQRGSDKETGEECDDGKDEEEEKCDNRECRDDQETTNIGENQGIVDEGCIPTLLHNPAKPDSPIFLDLDDEDEQPDINISQIVEDICMDTHSNSLSTQEPLQFLDGYDTGISNDLGPRATISGMYIILSCGCGEWCLSTMTYTRFWSGQENLCRPGGWSYPKYSHRHGLYCAEENSKAWS